MKRAIQHFLSACLAGVVAASTPASASDLASAWVPAYNSKVRLIAGHANAPGGGLRLFGGVEVAMAPGWKTYWRHPGDAGGLPPAFSFEGSENLAAATVLYPVPLRLTDPTGTSLGYKSEVVFPLVIEAKDAAKPVRLAVRFDYGICREICVPAEAALDLTIKAGEPVPAPMPLRSALAKVPSAPGLERPRDPRLVSAAYAPRTNSLAVEIRVPGGAAAGDLLVEAPDGIYLPLPVRAGGEGDTARFTVDTSDTAPGDLHGKTLRFTMIGGGGQAEAVWTVPPA